MKTQSFLISLLLFSNLSLAAERVVLTENIKDANVADVKIKIVDLEEPVYSPYRLSVTVKCADKRKIPNSVKPTVQVALKDTQICAFRPHSYNSATKTLTLHYSTINDDFVGQAQCDNHLKFTVKLAEFCEVWQR